MTKNKAFAVIRRPLSLAALRAVQGGASKGFSVDIKPGDTADKTDSQWGNVCPEAR